jgi:hypothetical protein
MAISIYLYNHYFSFNNFEFNYKILELSMRLNLQKLLKEKNVDNEILVKNFLDTQNKEKIILL